ncbi:MAG: TlpA family protein disulfide reductase [Myxococcales bacterium]|nr:MAG: TlpA family protein disulfide reductase [Myxococcales bacterium]
MKREVLRIVLSIGLMCLGCSGNSAYQGTTVRENDEVRIDLIDADGAQLPIEAFRGHPLLVFVFTTFDGYSQIALHHVETFHKTHSEITILAIAVQPEPGRILRAFKASLQADFSIAYDPSNSLLQGKSDFGVLNVIPAYFLLDKQGKISKSYQGPMTDDQLVQWLD